jgi:hypothetical protein
MLPAKQGFEGSDDDANYSKSYSSVLNPGAGGAGDLYPRPRPPNLCLAALGNAILFINFGLFRRIGRYERERGEISVWFQALIIMELPLEMPNRKAEPLVLAPATAE